MRPDAAAQPYFHLLEITVGLILAEDPGAAVLVGPPVSYEYCRGVVVVPLGRACRSPRAQGLLFDATLLRHHPRHFAIDPSIPHQHVGPVDAVALAVQPD